MGRVDILWPSEEMRANGGRLGWKGWNPRAGMVGYVVHYWVPNHVDRRRRSHTNRVVYVVEIGMHFVPVGEFGLREYNQIVESSSSAEEVLTRSRRSSIQFDFDEFYRRQQQQQHQLYLQLQHQQQQHQQQQQQQQMATTEREGLTPILGSSVESPTSHLANLSGQSSLEPMTNFGMGLGNIKAVSSSSSEDEVGLMNLEQQKREMFFNMWKLITDNKQSENLTLPAAVPTVSVDLDETTTTPSEEIVAKEHVSETTSVENLELATTLDVVEETKEEALEVKMHDDKVVVTELSVDESLSDAAEFVEAQTELTDNNEQEEEQEQVVTLDKETEMESASPTETEEVKNLKEVIEEKE